jgi:hypothetical protein
MKEPLREIDYFKTWAAYIACVTIGGFIVGAIAGGILGVVLTLAGVHSNSLKLWGGLAGFIAGLPVSYGFFRLFVSQMLIPRIQVAGEKPNQPPAPTPPAAPAPAAPETHQP